VLAPAAAPIAAKANRTAGKATLFMTVSSLE
jgi:hypothetical protein